MLSKLTNKEAISLLDEMWRMLTTAYDAIPNTYVTAYCMAAEALRAQDVDGDTISRRAAIDIVVFECGEWAGLAKEISKQLKQLPPAQPERDIPKKPTETTDRTWGIPHRQAVCPNCDCYLGAALFIGADKKRKVTYCEYCGQAIDWEGWDGE